MTNTPETPSADEANQPATVGFRVKRLVIFLRQLFCHHNRRYFSEKGAPQRRRCSKCNLVEVLQNDGGCHGDAWWAKI